MQCLDALIAKITLYLSHKGLVKNIITNIMINLEISKTTISKGSESDLNPLLTEGQEEKGEQDVKAEINFCKYIEAEEKRLNIEMVDQRKESQIFEDSPSVKPKDNIIKPDKKTMVKEEKALFQEEFLIEDNCSSQESGIEFSPDDIQDSPLLNNKQVNKLPQSLLKDIQEIAPMTLHQTMKQKLRRKRSKSLMAFSPEMDGILKFVARDMTEAIIDKYDLYSLPERKPGDDLMFKPQIQAELLSPGTSDLDRSNIIVNELVLDDSEPSINMDSELKMEDLVIDPSPKKAEDDELIKTSDLIKLFSKKEIEESFLSKNEENQDEKSKNSGIWQNPFQEFSQKKIQEMCEGENL